MRNMKKFLALVLAMLMITSMAVMTTSAADEADYTDAAQTLAMLKIMKGNENGDLMLENGVTRYQTALFFAQALTGKTDAAVWNAEKKSASFADVVEYGTAIDYVAGLNVVKGRGNGVFGYNDAIIYQDMIVMAVRALGYETADMTYPYGHILAAQKLGLLEDIDLVNYKAELKRGETAQLIYNMLNAPVAVIDPLTNKPIYEGEEEASLAGALSDKLLASLKNRETLMDKAEFVDGKYEGNIIAFTPADEDEEIPAKVTVADKEGNVDFVAADLGITEETAPSSYLGLPVTVLTDCDKKDFADKYEAGEAAVVVVKYPKYTTVTNVGADTNIKFVLNTDDANKSYVALGAEKFTEKDYTGLLYFWDDAKGWQPQKTSEWDLLKLSFAYNNKDGYDIEGKTAPAGKKLNTNAIVTYRVIENLEGKDTVEVFYTALEFGQYIERELPSAATGKDETYVAIGTYKAGAKDIDDNVTDFEEKLVGDKVVLDKSQANTKISKTRGEKAMTVEVVGEAVQSGDFMFYAYNKADNVLTVAKNCGTFETGRMTARNENKHTVKINGTNMEFGFEGLYNTLVAETATTKVEGKDESLVQAIIDTLEAGKDNVKYIAVDGKVVYYTLVEEVAETASSDYAIITTNMAVMMKLLDITNEDTYKGKLTSGLYVEDGYVVVAAINFTTGEWELVKVAAVATTYKDGEFTKEVDVPTLATYAQISKLSDENAAALKNAQDTFFTEKGLVVAVVEDNDGVYTIADADTVVDTDKGTKLVDRNTTKGALSFNTVGRTNEIKAVSASDSEVKPARVTTNDNTVIVVIDSKGEVLYRTGVQSNLKNIDEYVADSSEKGYSKKDLTATDTVFYSASEDLIVLTVAEDIVEAWGQGSAAASDASYYVVLPGLDVEYGTTDEEGVYTLTIAGLFDLRTYAAADVITVEGDFEKVIKPLADSFKGAEGKYVVVEGDKITVKDTNVANAFKAMYDDKNNTYTVGKMTQFSDAETIAIAGVANAADAQAAINVTVVTVDLTDFEWADIDVDNLYVEYDYANISGKEGMDSVAVELYDKDGNVTNTYCSYVLDLEESVVELTAPLTGVIGDFELEVDGKTIVAEDKEGDVVKFKVEYKVAAVRDLETETVTAYVVKTISVVK